MYGASGGAGSVGVRSTTLYTSANGLRSMAGAELYTRLRDTFCSVDVDGDRKLTRHEVKTLWLQLFPDMTEAAVDPLITQLMLDIDVDGNGEVTLEELKNYFAGTSTIDENIEEIEYEGTPNTLRLSIWAVVDNAYGSKWVDCPRLRKASLAFMSFTQIFILVSIVNMNIESLPELQSPGEVGESGTAATRAVETTCIAVFTLEFILRAACTPSQRQYWSSGFTWVDLLSILPFYFTQVGLLPSGSSAQSLIVLRILRLAKLVRVLRVLKLGRHSEGIQVMVIAVSKSGTALTWLVLLNLMAMVLFSSLIFFIEKEEAFFDAELGYWVRKENSQYPDAGKKCAFQSIPSAMWWAVVTLTTVGYGDEVPVTGLGKFVASVCMMCGLLVIAYPITILTSSFQRTFEEWKERKDFLKRRQQWLKDAQSRSRPSKAHNQSSDKLDICPLAPPSAARSQQQPQQQQQQQQSLDPRLVARLDAMATDLAMLTAEMQQLRAAMLPPCVPPSPPTQTPRLNN